MSIQELHSLFLTSSGICTDTRKLVPNQLYFALSGENFNGNSFAKSAIEQGAHKAIIDQEEYNTEDTILVKDVLTTLQELAKYHRQYLKIPIIGLTGSNGKTTTKELINAALSQKFKTYATQGNFNNHIGVPLTLLAMNKQTEIGVVEMGANHQKEIEELCSIAQPNYGLITNFGKAHLEGFGGIEGVIKGKSELYTYLLQNQATAFINDKDPIQLAKSQMIANRKTFGSSESNYPITLEKEAPNLSVSYKNTTINSHLSGTYNFTNIAVAVALGVYFNVPIKAIKKGIESYRPKNNRSQLIKIGNHTIILDAYNANPTSMDAALRNLKTQASQNSIAFIGDMFEVGRTTLQEHQAILDLAQELRTTHVYAIGPSFGQSQPNSTHQEVYHSYEDFTHSLSASKVSLSKILPDHSTILIKGSRGMKMERILDLLIKA